MTYCEFYRALLVKFLGLGVLFNILGAICKRSLGEWLGGNFILKKT